MVKIYISVYYSIAYKDMPTRTGSLMKITLPLAHQECDTTSQSTLRTIVQDRTCRVLHFDRSHFPRARAKEDESIFLELAKPSVFNEMQRLKPCLE